jgi:hypothetical protein
MLENRGDEGFVQHANFAAPDGARIPIAADFNADGAIDVTVPGESSLLAGGGGIQVYRGQPRPASVDALSLDGPFAGRPNPFRDAIRFRLQPDMPARLEIFDSTGRMVRRIEAEPTRDRRDVSWDGKDARGRDVPAGIYVARVRQSGRTEATRVLRLR